MSSFFISQPANSFSAYPFYIFIYYYVALSFYIKREQLFSVGLLKRQHNMRIRPQKNAKANQQFSAFNQQLLRKAAPPALLFIAAKGHSINVLV
jgi:hypothetical protein